MEKVATDPYIHGQGTALRNSPPLIRPEIGLSWSPRCDKPEMNMAEAVGWRDWLGRLQAEGKLPTGGQTLDGMRLALRRGLEVLEETPPELAEMRLLQYPGPAGPMEARLYVPLAGGLPPARRRLAYAYSGDRVPARAGQQVSRRLR